MVTTYTEKRLESLEEVVEYLKTLTNGFTVRIESNDGTTRTTATYDKP